jgi:hypothetical protein
LVGQGLRERLPAGIAAALKRLLGRRPETETPAHPIDMEMNCLPESEVEAIASGMGCVVEGCVYTNATEADFGGRLEFFDAPAARRRIRWRRARLPSPYLSALYFIRRPAGPTSP